MILSLAAGLLLALSANPWNLWLLAITGLALMFRLTRARSWKKRFRNGWISAMVMFALGLAWQRQFSVPGWLLLSAFEAMFVALAVAATPAKGTYRGVIFVAAITLAEAGRVRWPWGGLPMGGFTTGQASGPLAPVVSLVGEPGLVFVLGLFAMAAVHIPQLNPARWKAAFLVGWPALLVGLVLVIVGHHVYAPSSGIMNVVTVQGGGPQALSRKDQDAQRVFMAHYSLSAQIVEPVDVVVWPENIIDVDEPVVDSLVSDSMSQLARSLRAPIVSGVVEVENLRFRNAAVVWNPDGSVGSQYEKVHRVPFGEYVPFRGFIDRFADLSQVPRDAYVGTGPAVLQVGNHKAGVALSFEGLFASRARAAIRDGGEVLFIPTNASSYKSANVAKSQVQAARLRALETGRAVVQSSPTGLSVIVNQRGKVLGKSTIGPPAVLQATVNLSRYETPYVRHGDTPLIALSAGVLVLYGLSRLRTRRTQNK